MDWKKLKEEYICGGTSYRKLAEKYEISLSTLSKVAAKERWAELKEAAKQESNDEIVKAIGKRQAKRMERLQTVTDKVLTKIETVVDDMTAAQLLSSLKLITGAIKDIKDVQRSGSDIKEQEARINKLIKDVESSGGDENEGYGVLLMPDISGELTPPSEVQDNG